MNKLINCHSLSVGYNLSGQEFFDTIAMFSEYIHSYFFSLTDSIGCNTLDVNYVSKTIEDSDSYNIPGNLLLNTRKAETICRELICIAKDITNLSAVTVLTLDTAETIKQLFPDISIHLSVRYWDYSPDIQCHELLEKNIERIMEFIDVINISDVRSFNDFHLANRIRALGIKTKFIVNEGCIVNRTANYSKFPGFENEACSGAPCKVSCYKFTEKYPWMVLGRALLYKEFIPLMEHKYDIWKLSTRHSSIDEIFKLLQYWTSDEKTKYINCNGVYLDLHNYDVYMEWINEKLKCNHNCWECQKCKEIFNKLKQEE